MATRSRRNWGGQILVQIGVMRSGNVPFEIGAMAARGIHEIEAAIDDGEVRFAHQAAQCRGAD